MILWHISNTTVRTPYRLRDALRVLQGSSLNGDMCGIDKANSFAKLLHDNGVLNAPRIENDQDAPDLGRKWRAALYQLGFITPRLSKGKVKSIIDPILQPYTENIEKLTGRPYEITPNGYRLANSQIITAQQECFLRSIFTYRIPSIFETGYKFKSFFPLRYVLDIMHSLDSSSNESAISIEEFALFVQTSTPAEGVANTVENILNYRASRKKAKGNVGKFVREHYTSIANKVQKEVQTLDDYADLSFRYFKATGLFRSAGRGITLFPLRSELASMLREQELPLLDDKQYLRSLWVGAKLPTDNEEFSRKYISDLVDKLRDKGVQVESPNMKQFVPDLEIIRHEFEFKLMQLEERDYAICQSEELEEIIAWLTVLKTRRSVILSDGTSISIPNGERPAYFEWIIWRAFLAIYDASTPPWEARRFEIDQDFKPVHCAPGRGPDIFFEFEEFIVVVEVTLTVSSRQEAAEGEPVRRHVAEFVKENPKKPVYGLFIAIKVDTNTAHTFRFGEWYLSDEKKLLLQIVPITLEDFGVFLASHINRSTNNPDPLHRLLIDCRKASTLEAPLWKKAICSTIQEHSEMITNQHHRTHT